MFTQGVFHFKDAGFKPDFVAGRSLGELAALQLLVALAKMTLLNWYGIVLLQCQLVVLIVLLAMMLK